jgi:type IV secretory pathway TraG/TraD family ATPase VirD4
MSGGKVILARRWGKPVYADKKGKPHTLLLGPSGCGKTESGIIPNVQLWGNNPLVCASSKEDLLGPTYRIRQKYGKVYVADFRMGIFGMPLVLQRRLA